MDAQSEKPKRKKNVTTACLNCRKRKSKCDGKLPNCTSCVAYGQYCIYEFGADKRKIPLKTVIEHLTARVCLLEQTLRDSGIPVPPADDPPKDIQETLDSPELQHKTDTVTLATPNSIQASDPNLYQEQWTFETSLNERSFDGPPSESELEATIHQLPRTSRSVSADLQRKNVLSLSAINEVLDPVEEQLSRRMGSLQVAEDGQLRYFGATSNLHILHNGPSSLSSPSVRRVYDAQAVLNKAGVGACVPEELEDHLIKLYFAWEDPPLHIVREDLFFQERAKWKAGVRGSPFYSEVLTNAMCGMGATFSPRILHEIPGQATEYFSTRAKALLEVEMDCPTVATVQALVIMSALEAIYTRDARGWLYSGMAMRLATDLGLHMDPSHLVDSGVVSQEEADLRCLTFWGCYVKDILWGLYLGRPNMLKEENITAPLLRPNSSTTPFWRPYLDRDVEFPPASSIPHLVDESFREMISLCRIMKQVNRVLYMDVETSLTALQDIVENMQGQLDAWLQGLPRSLKLKLDNPQYIPPPHVLQLHMQYNAAVISLNRPFLSKDIYRADDVNYHLQMEACDRCAKAASSTSQILTEYRRLYTMRRTNVHLVHIVFTAAFILTYNSCRGQESGSESSQGELQICCQALRDLGQSFQNGSRALEVITCLKREWQVRTTGNHSHKRRTSSLEDQHNLARERNRPWAATEFEQAFVDENALPWWNSGLNQDVNAWAGNDFWLNTLFELSTTEPSLMSSG